MRKIALPQKPEDFIGQTFNAGKLKVIGIYGKRHSNTWFKVTCEICSPDTELFPDGYFVTTKAMLIEGNKPCGCGKTPRWEPWQIIIRVTREAEKSGFIIEGYDGEFIGTRTKVNCYCPTHDYRWKSMISNIMVGKGCPKCAGVYKPTEQEALDKCIKICKIYGYKPICFPHGYKNQNSRFEYECPKHGKQEVNYSSFIRLKGRCRCCYRDRQRESETGFYGWYPERADEVDFLYVVSFDNDSYLKVGRSFDTIRRFKDLKKESSCESIKTISIYTATHKEIYDSEQAIHEKLRSMGYEHHESSWSKETFNFNSLFALNNLLILTGLPEVEVF